jgi:hypothetical protein
MVKPRVKSKKRRSKATKAPNQFSPATGSKKDKRERADSGLVLPARGRRFKEILAKTRPPGIIAALAVGAVLYIFFAATTPIIPGGAGYDGQFYAAMAKDFSVAQLGHLPALKGPYNTRYLPCVIAHYIHPDPLTAFTILNIVAIVGIILAYYGILRFYGLPIKWTLVAIVVYLVGWPALRWWIYYPILTDPLGTTLFLTTIWTILTRRYLPYSLFAAALLATRENGSILFVFFALFHLNPWNQDRDKEGHPLVRIARLAAWNLFPLLVYLQVRLFPLFPQSNDFDMVKYAKAAMADTLTSPEKLYQMLLAILNGFGVLPYVLIWGIFYFGWRRSLLILRANLHWVWYVLVNIIFAAMSWTDQERFLTAAVPVFVLACVQIFRELPTGPKLTLAIITALAVWHAYLLHAFGPLGEYIQLWGAMMSAHTGDGIVRTHLLMASALGAVLVLKFVLDLGFAKSVGRILRRI